MGIVATPQQVLQLIRAHGLTQAQIAERTGIPQPTISKIERGAVEDVMSRSYLALVALLDLLDREPTAASDTPQAAPTGA